MMGALLEDATVVRVLDGFTTSCAKGSSTISSRRLLSGLILFATVVVREVLADQWV